MHLHLFIWLTPLSKVAYKSFSLENISFETSLQRASNGCANKQSVASAKPRLEGEDDTLWRERSQAQTGRMSFNEIIF